MSAANIMLNRGAPATGIFSPSRQAGTTAEHLAFDKPNLF
jgi:hypothetical protein